MQANLEFIHADHYGVALEITKKFVCKRAIRPILNYVHHNLEGDLIATDASKAIFIKKTHGFQEEYLVNPKINMFAKGNFPEIPVAKEQDYQATVELSKEHIKIWLQLIKTINQTMNLLKLSKNKTITFHFSEQIEAEVKALNMKITLPGTIIGKEVKKVSLNAEHLKDVMEAHFKLNSERVELFIGGEYSPVITDDHLKVRTMLTAIRIY